MNFFTYLPSLDGVCNPIQTVHVWAELQTPPGDGYLNAGQLLNVEHLQSSEFIVITRKTAISEAFPEPDIS